MKKKDEAIRKPRPSTDMLGGLNTSVLALAGYLAGYVNVIRSTQPKAPVASR